jgi:hypothetical protein
LKFPVRNMAERLLPSDFQFEKAAADVSML